MRGGAEPPPDIDNCRGVLRAVAGPSPQETTAENEGTVAAHPELFCGPNTRIFCSAGTRFAILMTKPEERTPVEIHRQLLPLRRLPHHLFTEDATPAQNTDSTSPSH